MARQYAKGSRPWVQQADHLSVPEIEHAYASGLAGVYHDPEEAAALNDDIRAGGGEPDADKVCHQYGLAESGKGRLTFLPEFIRQHYPRAVNGPAQERGDCVSHSGRNAALCSLVCEHVSGVPDEVTGRLEGLPKVSERGEANGVLTSSYLYDVRGFASDGWSCHEQGRKILAHGMLLCQNYPELGVDYTEYSGRQANQFRGNAPEKLRVEGRKHVVRTMTVCKSQEEVRDLIANGYGISTCGSEGYSSQWDENGVSKRSGTWYHAMALAGFDDRDITKQKYGEALGYLWQSWGKNWGAGPRTILGTNIQTPGGGFWVRWSQLKNRSFIAFSSLNGWPPNLLKSLGATNVRG